LSEQEIPEVDTQLKNTIAEIKKLQQGNVEKVRALAGMGRNIDPGSVANIKIDTFISLFLDERAQASYVLQMERNLREALDSALSDVRQQSLVNGVTPHKGGLIVP
jgi:hypothetical protein